MLRDAPLNDLEIGRSTLHAADPRGTRSGPQPVDDMLAAPFEATHHDVRGGVAIDYLTGEQVISRLLEVLGVCGWSFRILEHDIHPEADEVWVLGELRLLLNPDDLIVRQQFGSSKIKRARSTGVPLDIGFDLKSAATDCLKKCATLVGVGLYLTHKDEASPGIGAPTAQRNGRTPQTRAVRPRDRQTLITTLPTLADQGPSEPGAVLICERCEQPLQATPTRDGGEWTSVELAAYTRRQHNRTLCASCVRAARDASAASTALNASS